MSERYRTYEAFWPFYVSQHMNSTCRGLHFVGTTLVFTAVAFAARVVALVAPGRPSGGLRLRLGRPLLLREEPSRDLHLPALVAAGRLPDVPADAHREDAAGDRPGLRDVSGGGLEVVARPSSRFPRSTGRHPASPGHPRPGRSDPRPGHRDERGRLRPGGRRPFPAAAREEAERAGALVRSVLLNGSGAGADVAPVFRRLSTRRLPRRA